MSKTAMHIRTQWRDGVYMLIMVKQSTFRQMSFRNNLYSRHQSLKSYL